VIKELIAKEVVGLDSQPVALCYDMDALKETLLALKAAYPPHFLHAIAIKSNPLPFFLKFAVEQGFGLECASIAEVVLALRQGCSPDRIMFDSPAKSKREISFALRHNVQVNADNFFELDRIVEARAKLQADGVFSTSHVGVRVNPLVGLGAIKALSVSDARSKFGIPLNVENRKNMVELFRQYPWLDSVHIHVGSQGCSMEQHASGAAKLADFVGEIESAVGAGRVRVIDIGGGLPVNFDSEEVKPRYCDYSQILRHSAPALFTNPDRTIVTEYGRSVNAKAAWAVCAVEYVKESGDGLSIAVIQAGADLFMRTCYCPANFPLRVSGHNQTDGKRLVTGAQEANGANGQCVHGHADGGQGKMRGHVRPEARVTVAGPLCFGGDKIAEEVDLPQLQEGDFVVVHDAGANTLSTFSRYASRPFFDIFGVGHSFIIQRADGLSKHTTPVRGLTNKCVPQCRPSRPGSLPPVLVRYAHGRWTRSHCSRTAPPVYGYYCTQADDGKWSRINVVLLKPAESLEDVLSFWEGARVS
jgi:diaminopimelate decarboxylase